MRLAVWCFALLLAAPAQAVVFTVDSTVDAVDPVHAPSALRPPASGKGWRPSLASVLLLIHPGRTTRCA